MQSVDRVREQVRRWRDELINLSRRDRVLYYRPTAAASLLIEKPAIGTLAASLLHSNGVWHFYLPPVLPDPEEGEAGLDPFEVQPLRPSEVLTHRTEARKVENALRYLERRATQEAMDKGVWVLHLAAGFLHWIDPDNDNRVRSPLLLIPVRLDRASPRDRHRLLMAEEEPVVNPALAVKLESSFGIELPPLGDIEDLDINDYMARTQDAIDRPDWSVQPEMAIDVFSFHKEVMYKDLKDNEDLICDSSLIRALALGSAVDAELGFSPPSEEDLDVLHPPEKMATILDSDASQRRCIVAASQGHSFVMDGPPGTGKSQTIANIISQGIHDGKTILFVSEKIAALEVVKARLDAEGLGDYLLELHSHKAARKEVAQALYQSMQRYPRPPKQMGSAEIQKLVTRRKELSAYAEAMNQTRTPIDRSLQQVIGRIAQLHDSPNVTIPGAIDSTLDVERFQEILSAAEALSRAWSPVSMGDEFLWRGVDRTVATMGGKRAILEEIEEARDALAAFEREAALVSSDLELWWNDAPQSASRLIAVLFHLQERRPIPAEWLTSNSLGPVVSRVDELRSITTERCDAVERLQVAVGEDWLAADAYASDRLEAAEATLAEHRANGVISDDFDLSALGERFRFFSEADERLGRIESMSRQLADGLGLNLEPITLESVSGLLTLSDLVGASHQPESQWLDPLALPKLEEATSVLGALVDSYREKADALSTIFKPSVIELDLETLKARFDSLHRGIRKLGSAYRADKKLLAGETRIGKVTDEVIANLPAAIEWKRLAGDLESAEARHADSLGTHYYRGPDTDFASIADAIEVARRAVDLAGRHLADTDRFRTQLGRDGNPDSAIKLLASELRSALTEFDSDLTRLLPSTGAVRSSPVDEARDWFRQCAPLLEVVAAESANLEAVAHQEMSLKEARRALEDRSLVENLENSLESTWNDDVALLGDRYQAIHTDWTEVQLDLEWTTALREAVDAPVDIETAERLLATDIGPERVRELEKEWHSARDRVSAHFEVGSAEALVGELESSFLAARELLGDLAGTVELVDEWVAFSDARNRLSELGAGVPTEELVQAAVGSEQVVPALERVVLEAWADSVMESDPRLAYFRSEDRDAFVDDFRRLDRELVSKSAAVVMEAANGRRPTTNLGAAGLIQREGQKKRRHMPVRDLISQSSEVVQAMKPCFMMSPLSVSQFISADLRFDLVIFDEASQVKPADAANCVYRGRQLIVAGDQKQLPPTTFFEVVALDDGEEWEEGQLDEFESVLDIAKAGGMESLPLRWHYRSQHESLITYSNYSFYDGRLITFPGALAEAADVGLEFFYVEGEYRRGGARDNPIEAEKVAERVLYHAKNHPNLTLGVVAFSEAQASTIEYVLDQARRERPELDDFFDEDRLTGFFVKNLENVQGDERDIMIFSVGYGPDEMGKITMNFGPLNRTGGHRRLNVAITRARRRVEVVASLRASDFQPTTSAGARHLGRYLDFVDRGMSALALEISDERRDAESPFEEEVIRVISSWGFDVHPQVGVADYRVDVAVTDPSRPGAYVLGIECDGAMYHSSRVARDRDRLRQEVLEGLGWRIHRIWSTAWYRNRASEEARLREAIDRAISGESKRLTRRQPERGAVEFEEVDFDFPPPWAQEYVVSRPRAGQWYDGMHDPAAQVVLREGIQHVVDVEGPIHQDLVLRRLREAWGVGRTGTRVREAFDTALAAAKRNGSIRSDRYHFLWPANREDPIVRYPTTAPESERSVDQIAREELELAVLNLVRDARRIDWDELTVSVARLFGWGRRGPEISRALDSAVRRLIRSGSIQRDGDHLLLANNR